MSKNKKKLMKKKPAKKKISRPKKKTIKKGKIVKKRKVVRKIKTRKKPARGGGCAFGGKKPVSKKKGQEERFKHACRVFEFVSRSREGYKRVGDIIRTA